jgi:hypothetical protein
MLRPAPGVPAPDADPPAVRPAAPARPPRALTLPEVASRWAPLAGSWLLMGLELPVVSAVMARLPHATVSLAAYGGVVYPLALLIEAPILMLLTASTALARDARSYAVVRRFMYTAAGLLTAAHALIAFTPLFDFIASTLIAIPEPVREPARLGLRIMLPWTLSIAYRRTQQGVLIRFDHARAVTWGTMVRLATLSAVLAVGSWLGGWPAIAVGTCAVACGVVSEAVFAGVAVRPVRRGALAAAPVAEPPLTMRAFVRFYTPLGLTPLLNFMSLPLASAAMSRMPNALESLAAWPVLSGSTLAVRSLGFAYNEVMVALLDRWRPVPALRKFAWGLATLSSGLLLAGAATRIGLWWFARGSALPETLAHMAWRALWLVVPMGAVSVWQSYHQSALVYAHRTREVTASMLVFLVAAATVLGVGVAWRSLPGLGFAALALTAGSAAQIAWLTYRSQPVLRDLEARDAG